MSSLNIMALQYVILIRKWVKLHWFVRLVKRICECDGVDSNFVNFKTHKCTHDTEIVILLRERIVP